MPKKQFINRLPKKPPISGIPVNPGATPGIGIPTNPVLPTVPVTSPRQPTSVIEVLEAEKERVRRLREGKPPAALSQVQLQKENKFANSEQAKIIAAEKAEAIRRFGTHAEQIGFPPPEVQPPTPGIGIPTNPVLPTVPVTPVAPKLPPATFEDVLRPLEGGPAKIDVPTIERGIAGEKRFEEGLSDLRGPGGISPEIQSVLDRIDAKTKEDITSAGSRQQALAGRRGIQGSTIEGANVAAAEAEQSRIGRDLSTGVLLESARQQIAGRRAAGAASIARAGEEAGIQVTKELAEFEADVVGQALFAELDQNSRLAAANLTSDEVASIRNLQEAGKDRELQKFLGERGIAVQQQNIAASRDIARQQGKSEAGGGVGTLVGAGVGFAVGGPVGAAIGGFLGGTVGKFFPF